MSSPSTVPTVDVLIQPVNRLLRIAVGSNLLEALQAAQVPMSYSCMAGRCGTCRCRLVDGEVLEGGQDAQRPFDGPDDHILACRTYVSEPCVIEIPEPGEVVVHPARIVKATVDAIDDLTHDIKRLRLKLAKPIEFSPGQYVRLQFTPEHVRSYSMANARADETFEFHVRRVPEGRVTGYIEQHLRVGDAVRVSGPLGSAYLRRRHEGPMLCVAGGTGLAPILSIVRGAIDSGLPNPIHVYVGARSPRDVYGLDWLQALQQAHPALALHVVVTSGAESPAQRSGMVTEAIEQDFDRLDGFRAYLCGSPPMVEATAQLVRHLGLDPRHVHADAFYAQET